MRTSDRFRADGLLAFFAAYQGHTRITDENLLGLFNKSTALVDVRLEHSFGVQGTL
jgi:hypothetical protein